MLALWNKISGAGRVPLTPAGPFTTRPQGGQAVPEHITPEPLPQQEQVEYRDVPGFPGYRVGSDGSVWSCVATVRLPGRRAGWTRTLTDHWHRLAPGVHSRTGHLHVHLCRCGRKHTCKVHHLVLALFVGSRPSGAQCLHGDGNPANNRPGNLRWGRPKENVEDMRRHGTLLRGVASPGAKLCEGVVRSMRAMRGAGATLQEIADCCRVSRATACRVLQGRIWGWVE
jgi:hypothetical protein